jgi:hypothetical protein
MEKVKEKGGRPGLGRELELELIQTHIPMIQKPLLWVEVGKSACVLVGIGLVVVTETAFMFSLALACQK